MEKGLLAAVRRFPLHGGEIRRLVLVNPGFRSLCDDLADAELALEQWCKSSSLQREARCLEYRILVAELASEIADSLSINNGAVSPPD